MSKYVIAVCGMLVLAASSCFAQQPLANDLPATKEDILKMFEVMNSRQQVRQVMEQVMQQMRAMNREQIKKRRPDITEGELSRLDQESEEIAKNFPVEEMMDDMVPVYQKHLSKTDVKAMIAFYSSPTGKKLLRDMPSLMSEAMQAAYPRMQKHLDAITKRLDEKANERDAKNPPTNKSPN